MASLCPRSTNQTMCVTMATISTPRPKSLSPGPVKSCLNEFVLAPPSRGSRTMICNPPEKMGWEKSNCCSRSALIEMAAMPKSSLPTRTASSSFVTFGYTSKSDSTPNSAARLRHKSMLNPDRSLPSRITNGGSSRVATLRVVPLGGAATA